MIKHVKFKKLSIKNFLSVGEEPVVINFQPGVNIITGKNKDQLDRRNGIGKSTITDALSFVLFGNTLRDLKKEFIINNITGKTAEIGLEFTITLGNSVKRYELYRSIDPSKFFLYEDGVDLTRDSMVNTTDYLQNTLNITPEIFQNCIVMAVNNTTPFMAKKRVEKRKFIESIFNLEVFSRMNNILKDEYGEVKRSFDISAGKHEELNTLLSKIKGQKENQIKAEEEQKEKLAKRKQDYVDQVTEQEKKLETFKEIKLDEVHSKIEELKVKESNVSDEIKLTHKHIASLETKNEYTFSTYSKIGTESDVCPVCLRGIDTENKKHTHTRKKEIKKEIDEISNAIKTDEKVLGELEVKRNKIVDGLKALENIINKKKLLDQQKAHINNNIKNLKQQIKDVETDISNIKSTTNTFDSIFTETEGKINSLTAEINQQKDLLNTLDTVKFVISEEGVKSFIVKKILKLFNSKLGYYLRRLHSTAIITFNEYFEETIINEKGKFTCYDNYSGAERKVIDLAIMFTFLDMLKLQGNVFYSLQMYDELLDTSLDEAGVEMVLGILNEFVLDKDLGIYIISHRKECAKISSNDLVFLEKSNGITKRVEAKVE
jgi:DNA repair exonuclease SbcCD ATPase subunit